MLCRVAPKLTKLPGIEAKIREATDLPRLCGHDWRFLTAVFVRLDDKVRTGQARPRNPVTYALGKMFEEMRSPEFSSELDAFYAKVERLQKSEPVVANPLEEKWLVTIRNWVAEARKAHPDDAPELMEEKILDHIDQKHPMAPDFVRVFLHRELFGEAG